MKYLSQTTGKTQRLLEELVVAVVPLLIFLIIVGAVWALIDEATPENPILDLLSPSSGALGFFTGLPSDGMKILLVGVLILAVFGGLTVAAVTAKEGRRFWYKLLFRKEPP